MSECTLSVGYPVHVTSDLSGQRGCAKQSKLILHCTGDNEGMTKSSFLAAQIFPTIGTNVRLHLEM